MWTKRPETIVLPHGCPSFLIPSACASARSYVLAERAFRRMTQEDISDADHTARSTITIQIGSRRLPCRAVLDGVSRDARLPSCGIWPFPSS